MVEMFDSSRIYVSPFIRILNLLTENWSRQQLRSLVGTSPTPISRHATTLEHDHHQGILILIVWNLGILCGLGRSFPNRQDGGAQNDEEPAAAREEEGAEKGPGQFGGFLFTRLCI